MDRPRVRHMRVMLPPHMRRPAKAGAVVDDLRAGSSCRRMRSACRKQMHMELCSGAMSGRALQRLPACITASRRP
jgi:hypothetical protein